MMSSINWTQLCIILHESKVETWYLSNGGYVDHNQFLKNVSEKCQWDAYDYIFYEYAFIVVLVSHVYFLFMFEYKNVGFFGASVYNVNHVNIQQEYTDIFKNIFDHVQRSIQKYI